MDIIDIVLAKALTPQQLATYIAQAQQATSIATTAAENISSITEQTNTNNTNAEAALTNVNAALSNISAAASTEIKKLTFNKTLTTGTNVVNTDLNITYPDNTTANVSALVKYYTTLGNNTDGSLTQNAISSLFNDYESLISTLTNNLEQVQQDIEDIKEHGGGGGSTDMGSNNAGKMVTVGDNGLITVSNITEEALIEALIKSGDYLAQDAVGLQIDYENRTFIRVQEATNYELGDDFNKYSMYGGRTLCNVNDNGEIVAWYGDNNYREDGSNGQVMIYQPKFYYSRVPSKVSELNTGTAIRKETLIITPTAQTGFKLHPLFKAADGSELDYILISAYEGCAYTDHYDLNDSGNIDFTTAKLSSVAGAKPISGVNKRLTLANAEQMAQNRGSGWHVTNMAAESMQQMLQLVEYGTLNSQAALETGLSYLSNNASANCASITGSTANLGNGTGAADSTVNEINGTYHTYTEPGYRAVRYRGFENPWGNIWRMIAGMQIVGNRTQNGGIVQLCNNFNYDDANNYTSIGFQLPSNYDWISAFGAPVAEYDWVFMPIECSGGNSALPVGDNLWTTPSLNRTNMACVGGQWYFELNNGMFYYGCDQAENTSARSFSARLMYIPTKNSIYNKNVTAWRNRQ